LNSIPPEEVRVDPTSYVDPNGRLFVWEGEHFRGIHPASADLVRGLLNNSRVQRFISDGSLVGTEISKHTLDGFALVLKHETIWPRTYCVEWPPEMLRDAGALTLELCRELLKDGLTLQDAYPWNVLFRKGKPVFVDFGSIVPAEGKYLWKPYEQFCRFFLFPLYLCSSGLDEVARKLLFNYLSGVTPEQCSRLLPGSFSRRNWQVMSRLHLPLMLQNVMTTFRLEEKIKQSASKVEINMTSAREGFFWGLARDLNKIKLPIKRTEWSEYQEWPDWKQSEEWNAKQKVIHRFLEQLQPDTVLDVACNNGWYSILAAKSGAQVVAMDQDASCVAKLYEEVRKGGLDVLPLIIDILNPPPAFGWNLQQFPSALNRLQGDMVIALALLHHLVITQWQSVERVVTLLAGLTRKWLVLEFVPLSDEKSQIILGETRTSFEWYNLDNLIKVLETVFAKVEVHDSYPEGRQLILATK
jgi:SAM-dependent methyltransferase